MRTQIATDKGARPQGPYSQAIVTSGTMVYVSGQGPVDPATGQLCLGSFREQAERTFENIGILLQAAGTSWQHVVKVGAFLADYGNFAEYNEIYQRYFSPPYPARTTVQAGLGRIAIEIDCIAVIPQG